MFNIFKTRESRAINMIVNDLIFMLKFLEVEKIIHEKYFIIAAAAIIIQATPDHKKNMSLRKIFSKTLNIAVHDEPSWNNLFKAYRDGVNCPRTKFIGIYLDYNRLVKNILKNGNINNNAFIIFLLRLSKDVSGEVCKIDIFSIPLIQKSFKKTLIKTKKI